MQEINDISFEEALKELEQIISVLEKGECSLEKAIEYYEKGNALRILCNEKLNAAKEKIEKITADYIEAQNKDSEQESKILEFNF